MTSSRVTVIGGGVIGLSLAWELSRRNCDVVLVDRDQLGQGTSWTAAGILPPANLATATDPLDRLRGLSHQLYPRWADHLQDETGIDIQLDRCGGWYLADSIGERAAMLGMQSYWDELAIECHNVPLSDLVVREPALAHWAAGSNQRAAWWVPDEYQVRPPRLLSALIAACQHQCVEIHPQTRVIDLQPESSSVRVVTTKTNWQSDQVVVCCGAWAGRIAQAMQLDQAVIPIRGQMLLLKTAAPVANAVINVGNRYVVARRDGHTLVGSCEEEVGFENQTDPDTIDQITRFAEDLIPQLGNATKVRSWAGFRPMTFDGFPMIGPVPQMPGVHVAAGHFRSGIHLAPATAVLLSDAILESHTLPDGPTTGREDRSPVLDLNAFRVGKQQHHPASLSAPNR